MTRPFHLGFMSILLIMVPAAWANSTVQTLDGRFAIAGRYNKEGSLTYDAWVAKLNQNGKME